MIEIKYTPGPWKFVPWYIAEGPSEVRAPEGWLICCTTSDANAQLIAAAPELLEEGRSLIASLDPGTLNPEQFIAWSALKDACAKATAQADCETRIRPAITLQPVAWLTKRYDLNGVLLDTEVHLKKPAISSTARTDFTPLYTIDHQPVATEPVAKLWDDIEPNDPFQAATEVNALSGGECRQTFWWELKAKAMAAYLSALHAKAGVSVEVKELEWVQLYEKHTMHPKEWHGTGIFDARYIIKQRSKDSEFFVVGKNHKTLEAAKSAAQTDYEARIRSTLAHQPVTAGLEKALETINAMPRYPQSLSDEQVSSLHRRYHKALDLAEAALKSEGRPAQPDILAGIDRLANGGLRK